MHHLKTYGNVMAADRIILQNVKKIAGNIIFIRCPDIEHS
jgi:hypothetical protein